MEISAQQFAGIAHCFPLQRGNVSLPNRQVLNAILYMMTHDCAWRDLPEHFGHWHTVYTRMNRWAKAGVLTEVFAQLRDAGIVHLKVEVLTVECARRKPRRKRAKARMRSLVNLSMISDTPDADRHLTDPAASQGNPSRYRVDGPRQVMHLRTTLPAQRHASAASTASLSAAGWAVMRSR